VGAKHVLVDERLGLGMVGSHSLLDCGLVIVRPLVQLAAASIAFSGNLGLIERNVVGRAALAHPSAWGMGPGETVLHPAAQNVVLGQATSEGKSSIFWPLGISEPSLIK
jgi:hypothetical protein